MVDESYAFITCQCGQKFQVLNQDNTDWNEPVTAQTYNAHSLTCKGGR